MGISGGREPRRPLVPLRLTGSRGDEVSRSARHRKVRATTVNQIHGMKDVLREREQLAALDVQIDHPRPRIRSDCWEADRPCVYVGCRHHLFLEVNAENGSIKFNFPDLDPDEIPNSCSLDVAEHGGITLEAVGELTNLTRERARQIEVRALARFERRLSLARLDELARPLKR